MLFNVNSYVYTTDSQSSANNHGQVAVASTVANALPFMNPQPANDRKHPMVLTTFLSPAAVANVGILTRLPREVRNRVYHYATSPTKYMYLKNSEGIAFIDVEDGPGNANNSASLFQRVYEQGIHRANRQLRTEATSFLCGSHELLFYSEKALRQFLNSIGPVGRSQIRRPIFVPEKIPFKKGLPAHFDDCKNLIEFKLDLSRVIYNVPWDGDHEKLLTSVPWERLGRMKERG